MAGAAAPVDVATAGASGAGAAPQLYTVGFYDDPDVERGDTFHGAKVLAVNDKIDFIAVRSDDPALFEAQAAQDPDVRYYNEDSQDALMAHYTPNDPRIGEQWGWDPTPGIDGYGAWDVTLGTTATLVAVIDSGLDKSHEDIGNYLQGYDYVNDDNDPDDQCDHGTHVSGTIGALTDNGVGVAGTAQTSILPLKALAPGMFGSCSGSFADVASAITDATDAGADVISMSLGCDGCSDQAVTDAIQYAWDNGVLLVASAGNAGPCSDCVGFPANDPNVIAVSALSSDGSLASFSSTGSEVELAAPGDNILSTVPGGYAQMDGTSMAAPHVSGVAALTLATQSLSNSQLRNHLKSTAVDVGLSANEQGSGAVNACNAVGGSNCGAGSGGGGGGGDSGTMHVHDIDHYRKGKNVYIDIWVYDDTETGVSGATVSVEVCDETNTCATGSGDTSSSGFIEFRWRGAGSGTYTTCVTGLTHSSYTWDSAADHAGSGSCETEAV